MPPPPRPFAQVDVFTAQPTMGNPVAVVLDGAGLDDEAMQRFARWTHLSETTFVLPPTDARADYRLRIFRNKGTEVINFQGISRPSPTTPHAKP